MKRLRALTTKELSRAEARLRNPALGSRAEAAKRAGVDLTLLIEQLRLSPADRIRQMLRLANMAEAVRGAARRKNP